MPDDDDDAREEIHEADGDTAPPPATRSRPRSSSASRGRSSRVARAAGRLRRPRGRGTTSRTLLRDDEQFTQCVDVTAVDHLVDAERGSQSTASRPSASRSSRTSCRTRATGASARSAQVPADGPDDREHRRPVPGHELRRARGLRPVRHHVHRASRPHAHPHARRLGRATRCARTTAPRACRSRSRKIRVRDEHDRASMTSRQRPTTSSALEAQTDEGAQVRSQPRRARASSC